MLICLAVESYKVSAESVEIFAHDIGNRVNSARQISQGIPKNERRRTTTQKEENSERQLAIRRHISKYG